MTETRVRDYIADLTRQAEHQQAQLQVEREARQQQKDQIAQVCSTAFRLHGYSALVGLAERFGLPLSRSAAQWRRVWVDSDSGLAMRNITRRVDIPHDEESLQCICESHPWEPTEREILDEVPGGRRYLLDLTYCESPLCAARQDLLQRTIALPPGWSLMPRQ